MIRTTTLNDDRINHDKNIAMDENWLKLGPRGSIKMTEKMISYYVEKYRSHSIYISGFIIGNCHHKHCHCRHYSGHAIYFEEILDEIFVLHKVSDGS